MTNTVETMPPKISNGRLADVRPAQRNNQNIDIDIARPTTYQIV